MKRIKEACILKTIHFQLKEGEQQSYAAQMVVKEVEKYKEELVRKKISHEITEENLQSDGSVIMKIKMQYGTAPCGEYLNAK